MRRNVLPAMALALAVISGCASGSEPPTQDSDVPNPPVVQYQPVTAAERQKAVDADGVLAGRLLKALGKPADNIVFSPYSISTALQLALLGASGNTADEMRTGLARTGLSNDQIARAAATLRANLAEFATQPDSLVTTANCVWPQSGATLVPAYVAALRDAYGVAVRPIDFAADTTKAVKAINKAIDEQTNGKIKKLFEDLASDTRLVLTNAVYLNAKWAQPFNADLTTDGQFRTSDGTTVPAKVMSASGSYPYRAAAGYQVVRLPYVGGRLAMTLLVPEAGLAQLEAELAAKGFEALVGALVDTPMSLGMPRFKTETNLDLVPTLQSMGIVQAFTDQAEFSGMLTGEQLKIDQVVHRAVIEVGEKGTEAAAATGVTMVPTSAPQTSVLIDRPFLYAITDTASGAALFLGRVTNPSA